MLVALSARSAHAASRQTDPLYIDAINRALIGDFPGAIGVYTHLASRVPDSEKAQVLVDLGRAHERNDEVPKALDAYREAARLDSQNAAAHLRTAILLGTRQLKLAEAATEFQKILNHRYVVVGDPIGALAHLQLGRAYAMQGDKAKAKAAYEDFLTIWKDADPDIPVYKQAKAEYAKLK